MEKKNSPKRQIDENYVEKSFWTKPSKVKKATTTATAIKNKKANNERQKAKKKWTNNATELIVSECNTTRLSVLCMFALNCDSIYRI